MTDLLAVDWSRLPAPVDDGAAKHLPGQVLPALALPATDGRAIDLSAIGGSMVVGAESAHAMRRRRLISSRGDRLGHRNRLKIELRN